MVRPEHAAQRLAHPKPADGAHMVARKEEDNNDAEFDGMYDSSADEDDSDEEAAVARAA